MVTDKIRNLFWRHIHDNEVITFYNIGHVHWHLICSNPCDDITQWFIIRKRCESVQFRCNRNKVSLISSHSGGGQLLMMFTCYVTICGQFLQGCKKMTLWKIWSKLLSGALTSHFLTSGPLAFLMSALVSQDQSQGNHSIGCSL